jgi:putative membrane protein PagO
VRKLITPILFMLVSFTWGTTWMAMKLASETIPPVFATGMRFLFAAPFLILISILTKAPLLFPKGQRIFQSAVCLFYFSIPFTLMIYGENYVDSGLASVIFSNMPVAVLLASSFFLNEKINKIQLVGLFFSLVSISGILLNESNSGPESHWKGILALVFAVIIHAIVYVQCKKRSCNVSVVTFNTLPCLFSGLILFLLGYIVEKPHMENFSIYSIFSTVYLGVFAGVFGILSYFALQKAATAFQASIVFLIFPLIAVSLENYIYGYTLSSYSLFLVFPLLIGVFLILIPTSMQRRC